MNELNFIKDELFRKILQEGIENIPSTKKYVALHVSSAHMSIYYEYYNTIDEIQKEKSKELLDPQNYSIIKIIWDCEDKELMYYDLSNLTYDAFDHWKTESNYKED